MPGEASSLKVGADMQFEELSSDSESAKFLRDRVAPIEPVVSVDRASVVIEEGKKRFRLPKSHTAYDSEWISGGARQLREVVTERAILNAHGTLYVLPRQNSGGVAHIKPVCTHNKKITDLCSWRGLTVLAGTRAGAKPDGHYFGAGETGLWFGDIDDLWMLGKPSGTGGPWQQTSVKANQPSDPYLMTGYDQKSVELSHDGASAVQFTLEVDPLATGAWRTYKTVEVPATQTVGLQFPKGYSAHWVRVRASADCQATAQFTYE